MELYKKLLPSKRVRFKLISLLKVIPDKPMLQMQYRFKCKRRLDLQHPKRFTEKVQWYKLYYRNPAMGICADKYLVRGYLEKKGLGHLLNELYGVYRSPDEIDLDALPDRFVLKLSNGSSTNIIVKDKSKITMDIVRSKFKAFYAQSGAYAGREWCYHEHEPVIIAEKYLPALSDADVSADDYKFFCFNGKPAYILHITNRYTDKVNHLVYDSEWNQIKVDLEGSRSDEHSPRPDNLEEMLRIAGILSADFPAARVDLYSVRGEVKFGEITFFPWSGYVQFDPDSFDYTLGEKFILPERNH